MLWIGSLNLTLAPSALPGCDSCPHSADGVCGEWRSGPVPATDDPAYVPPRNRDPILQLHPLCEFGTDCSDCGGTLKRAATDVFPCAAIPPGACVASLPEGCRAPCPPRNILARVPPFAPAEDCMTSAQGFKYRGTAAATMDGIKCLPWSDTAVRRHVAHTPPLGPLAFLMWDTVAGGTGNHNHCRNLDFSSQPWCFTEPGRKEPCDVPVCAPPVDADGTHVGVSVWAVAARIHSVKAISASSVLCRFRDTGCLYASSLTAGLLSAEARSDEHTHTHP